LSGCLGLAVRGIKETVDPTQPILRDSAAFYTGGIQATAVLMPVRKGRSGAAAVLLGDEEANDQPMLGYRPSSSDDRMALWTVLTNRTGGMQEIEAQSETCALGATKSRIVALAPGQRVMLEPIWSAQDQNLENLDVTLTLKLHGIVEARKLALIRVREIREKE
jgi:hypothetical protein